jgi:hypothetical protein
MEKENVRVDGEQYKTLSLYTGPKVKIQIVKDCARRLLLLPHLIGM